MALQKCHTNISSRTHRKYRDNDAIILKYRDKYRNDDNCNSTDTVMLLRSDSGALERKVYTGCIQAHAAS